VVVVSRIGMLVEEDINGLISGVILILLVSLPIILMVIMP